MKVTQTALSDVLLIQPDVFSDERGRFLETWNKEKFAEIGIHDEFLQDNLSVSKKGTLRGLHFQTGEFAQAKLVSVAAGRVFDVAVDIRTDSPTYGKWVGVTLTDEDHTMLYIPKGFAHGFYVLSQEARFCYKCSFSYYQKAASSGIIWNDPTIGISWPLDGQPILSAQDASLPSFSSPS